MGDEELRDKQGKRALDYAGENGHEILGFLQDFIGFRAIPTPFGRAWAPGAGSKALHLLSAWHDQLLLQRLEAP